LLAVPVPYRLSAPARLEGSVQRVLVAPGDGFLKVAHVRPGDLVRAEQVLAEFSDQDLQLERRKWEGAVAQHENGYAAAMARSDRTQLMILHAKASEARAQLGLVEGQLARTRLTAPFDGVIIKGDLRQSLGAPVQRGEVLLTLAPAGTFRLIVEVDERDVGRIRPRQKGSLVLASMADHAWPFAIERVTPVAVARDGRNLFEVEAKLETVNPGMQPGLEGIAKVDVGAETVAWIYTHRVLDWLRVAFWSWGL
jgi:multidrug resistance efflux pump